MTRGWQIRPSARPGAGQRAMLPCWRPWSAPSPGLQTAEAWASPGGAEKTDRSRHGPGTAVGAGAGRGALHIGEGLPLERGALLSIRDTAAASEPAPCANDLPEGSALRALHAVAHAV